MSGTIADATDVAQLLHRFQKIRHFSKYLCEPLTPEDCVVQSMPDVSPIRWHLAHTTWFFETFVLKEFAPGYHWFSESFCELFNSYYNSVGDQFPRANRGLLSRPTVSEIEEYRDTVDDAVANFLTTGDYPTEIVARIVELGLQHEQQHQELMLTDIKHVFSCNPLHPQYNDAESTSTEIPALSWKHFDEGVFHFGHQGDSFAFDNESPRHRFFLHDFRLASRLVTCREYMDFIQDGGYERPEFWLSLGWNTRLERDWQAPLYWELRDGQWHHFTLNGFVPVEESLPVSHVSFFEADAFARWSDRRLPTEFEWEHAAATAPMEGNFVENGIFHPSNLVEVGGDNRIEIAQLFGDVWEWTNSQYLPYHGYAPPAGAIGEYNGKFMCNQFVLRGGSCATSAEHIRPSYRNFFPPDARWQFSGLRLAE